jgi:hypothetical protein
MRKISNKSKSYSSSGINSENSIVNENTGWETDFSSDIICSKKRPELSGLELIKIANKRCTLKSLFPRYRIQFEEKYSPSGWTHKARCPFPDHNDSTPSFSYNSIEDRFNCFGCSRFGKAVEFFSTMESMSKTQAAITLLEKFDDIEDAYVEIQDSYDDRIDLILLDFSITVNNYIESNPDAISFVEKLTWPVDVYLHKHLPKSTIDVDNLQARINTIKSKLV